MAGAATLMEQATRPIGAPPLRVLLLTEGTYPFHVGGVSTWCHGLIRSLPEVSFTVMALSHDPSVAPLFELPPNVERLVPVPVWGVLAAGEEDRDVGVMELVTRRRRARSRAVAQDVAPLLADVVEVLFSDGVRVDELGALSVRLHRVLQPVDCTTVLRDRAAWEAVADTLATCLPQEAASHGYGRVIPTVHELVTGYQWLTHWLAPLARPLPEADVVHAAMAGTCSLVGAVSKLERGTPFVLTEHGVFLREQHLAQRRDRDLLPKLLTLAYARATTELAYHLADQLSPCCAYNTRWERAHGADPARVRVAYYGVDPAGFPPGPPPVSDPAQVAWVGRINPLKDLETLLAAAASVHQARPDVRFHVHGGAGREDRQYELRCLRRRADLALEEVVVMHGYCRDAAAAFRAADIVVSSSISEGTPYSTVEAMLSERPVVTTSVGGVPEQVGDAGVVVAPRDPAAMASAIVELVDDPVARADMGAAARRRALTMFSAERSRDEHLALYERLAAGGGPLPPSAGVATSVGVRTSLPALRRRDVVAMADELVPLPVDRDEVAAVLESRGVTDAVACDQLGHSDVFSLAADVLAAVRGRRVIQPPALRTAPEPPEPDPALASRATNTVLLALLGPAVLVLLRAAGALDARRAAGLTVGFTVAMLATNSFSFATSRRASFSTAVNDRAGAWALLRRALFEAGTLIGLLALLAVAAGATLGWGFTTALAVALTGAFGLWVTAAVAAGLHEPVPVGALAFAATLFAVSLDRALARFTAGHVWLGVVAGLVLALGGVALILRARLRQAAVSGRDHRAIPSLSWRAVESTGPAALGLALSLLLVAPHAVAWLAVTGSTDRTESFVALELGLALGMVGLLVAMASLERGVEQARLAVWTTSTITTDRGAVSRAAAGQVEHLRSAFLIRFTIAAAGAGLLAAGAWPIGLGEHLSARTALIGALTGAA
ncbi:MAG TPA: GT4 family glycosyltransferase PelF, partial [Acidimicrobiales bacterium]